MWFSEADDFEWEAALVRVDARLGHGESRMTAIGYINNRLHVMVFTLRATTVRIISLRKANRREVRRYAQAQT